MIKCTKFDFRWGSAPDPVGSLQRSPKSPIAAFKVFLPRDAVYIYSPFIHQKLVYAVVVSVSVCVCVCVCVCHMYRRNMKQLRCGCPVKDLSL